MQNSEAVQAWIQGKMATFRILILVSKTEIRSREFSFSSRSLRRKITNLDLVSMPEIGGGFLSNKVETSWKILGTFLPEARTCFCSTVAQCTSDFPDSCVSASYRLCSGDGVVEVDGTMQHVKHSVWKGKSSAESDFKFKGKYVQHVGVVLWCLIW